MKTESPHSGARELWLLGPVLLGLVVGVQSMFWLWGIWWPVSPDAATLDTLTDLGRGLYWPDHDRAFYAVGCLLCLALMSSFASQWRHLIDRAVDWPEAEVRRLSLLMAAHVPVAASMAAFRLLYLPAQTLSLVAAAIGLLFGAAALRLARQGPAVPWPWWRPGSAMQTAAVVLLLALFVYIPVPSKLVAQAYAGDHLHHLDFYAMSAALAFHHGGALGTDFYTQYGVGWPMLLSALAHVSGALSYKLLMGLGVTWACIYFLALYGFLRRLVRDGAWAVAGLLLALLLQHFSGTDGQPKWLWPSSTVMRYSMDVFVFAACLLHARKRTPWLGLPAGLFVGLAVLLGTDTGIYLLFCLVCYLLCVGRVTQMQSDPEPPPKTARFAVLALGGFGCVFLGGLAVASRGTLLRAEFWLGWTESLRLHNDGFGHLPIASAVNSGWTAYGLLLLMLCCYLYALARLVDGLRQRSLTPDDLILGLLAVYGLSILLLFIARSHPYNLHHPSIPFCILLTRYLAQVWGAVRQAGTTSAFQAPHHFGQALTAAAPACCAYVLFLGLCVTVQLKPYPNAFSTLLQGPPYRQAPPPADSNYLFLSRRDGPLPNHRLDEVARFRAITELMHELSDAGRRQVAIISDNETAYELEAGVAPRFRHSPTLGSMAFKSQLSAFLDALAADPPDYVFFPLQAPKLIQNVPIEATFEQVLQAIRVNYVPDRQVAGMMIYRRRPPEYKEKP